MSIAVPQGYRLAGVYCGVKRNTSKLDLSLVVSDSPAVAAGVYTQSLRCFRYDESNTVCAVRRLAATGARGSTTSGIGRMPWACAPDAANAQTISIL